MPRAVVVGEFKGQEINCKRNCHAPACTGAVGGMAPLIETTFACVNGYSSIVMVILLSYFV